MEGLVVHKGARPVSWETLRALPDPVSHGRFHRPIRYDELIERVLDRAEHAGLAVKNAGYAITPGGERLFAVIKFEGEGQYGRTLGLRSSTDQTFATKGVAGATVFVCDNLAFSGDEFVFNRKSTSNLNLKTLVQGGMDKFLAHAAAFEGRVAQLQAAPITDIEAKAVIYDSVVDGRIAPLRLLPVVNEAYFDKGRKGEFPEVAENYGNRWGLHNAFTRAVKVLEDKTPASFYQTTQRLGKFFGV
jgi:hypothetical protein